MKEKFGFRIFIAVAVFLVSLYTLWPTWQVLSQPQDYDKPIEEQRRAIFKKENPEVATKAMTLGLDLAGGTHIVVEVDDSDIKNQRDKEDLLDRSLEILRNRVDQFGVSEPIISKSGDKRIVAELAGVGAEEARKLIGATALLEFKLVAEASDFAPVLDRIDAYFQKKGGVEAPVDLSQQREVKLRNVLFAEGSVELDKASIKVLEPIVAQLKEYPEIQLEIQGHTDNLGSEENNKRLSQGRAASVREYLIAQGVQEDRLVAIGYGEQRPVVSNNTEEGRAQNRRIEMHRTDEATIESANNAEESVTDLFGEVVSEGTQAEPDENKEETAEEFKKRPFGSLLVGLPGGRLGVRVTDELEMKRILSEKDVQALIPRKFQFLWGKDVEVIEGLRIRPLYFLKKRAEMTGQYIADASPGRSPTGDIEVSLSFKGKGPKLFGSVTGANIGRQLAIVLDGAVYSAPVIQGKITQGRASITGIGDFKEAKLLATTLRAGSLPAPMEIVELRSVGPTLGQENIKRGVQAALIGLALVVAFMVLYYLGAGIIASFVLLMNLLIIGAILSMFHATLTLPGIAGIILTIGMAVDANVIIFERIREELRNKRSVRGAVDAGFKRAFSAIFDSNVTTVGMALILYNIGTGPIKGFGLTLTIGIAASMFTALFLTRLILEVFISKVNAQSLSIGKGISGLINPTFSIITKSKGFVITSISLFVIGYAGTFALNKGFNWGIDFTGGKVYEVQFVSTPDRGAVEAALQAGGVEEASVRGVGTAEERMLLVSLEVGNPATSDQVQQAVANVSGGGTVVGEELVGPRIGEELRSSAIWSFLVALALIVVYIWIRFGRHGLGFGLAAVVALFHDVLITIGLYGLFGLEVSLTFVAACLTIVGYSLNDTIVVFDRVRENIETSGKDGFATKVNRAINQSLSRTLITSVTTLFVVAILAIFGGAGIQGFAIAMVLGVLVGTYSSMGVASPFVVWWSQRSIGSTPKKK
jgi:SecD/SecF fusion protein